MHHEERSPFRSFPFIFLVAFLFTGIGQTVSGQGVVASATTRNPLKSELHRRFGEVWVKTELYFGLSRRNGGFIQEWEWKNFSENEISPLLREGFTILGGEGQYMLHNSPQVIREQAKVLIVVHPLDERFDQTIDRIIDAYKRRFNQESVLKVSSFVRAKF